MALRQRGNIPLQIEKLVIENVRWAMNETLRIFWKGDREVVARAIRGLLQFDVPCIGVFKQSW